MGAAGLLDEIALERRRAIDEPQTEIAHRPAAAPTSFEKSRFIASMPSPLAATSNRRALSNSASTSGVARIEAKAHRRDDDLGERGDIPKAKIEALSRQRMDEMGGVADQRQPRADESARDAKAQREGSRREAGATSPDRRMNRYSSWRLKS